MAIALTGTGGLFTRIGKIGAAIRNINGFRGTTAAVGVTDDASALWGASGPKVKDANSAFTEINAQYASTLQSLMDGLYATQAGMRSSMNGTLTTLKTLAERTVIEMVHADAVLPSKDLTLALKELIRQMAGTADLVTANVVSASPAAASGNTGDANIVASVIGPTGVSRQYVFAEVIEVKATNDAQQGGGATAGQESFSVTGEAADQDALNWSYPDGSGASTTLTMVDPTLDATGGNLLVNSSFDTYSIADTPDNWDVIVGTAGTDMLDEGTEIYRAGGKSLAFLGTGDTPLNAIAQKFANNGLTGGNTSMLKPNTVYALNVLLSKSASLAAGVITFSLVSGVNAVVNDDAGTANTISVAHNSIMVGSFSNHSGFFRTPKVLPATGLKLRISLTTALTDEELLYVDDLAMCEAKEAYTGGPYLAAFRGATDVAKNDLWNVTISNDRAGIIQSLFDQLFAMRAKGLQLATGTPTVADTLVA